MGQRKLDIVSLLDKTAQVSVTNPICHDNTGVMDAFECMNNHSTCVIHCVRYYQTICPPGQEQFYCYQASTKLLKVSYIQTNNFFITILIFNSINFLSNRNTRRPINPINQILDSTSAKIILTLCAKILQNFANLRILICTRLMVNVLLALPCF